MSIEDYNDLRVLLEAQTQQITDAIRLLRRDVLVAALLTSATHIRLLVPPGSDVFDIAERAFSAADTLLEQSDLRMVRP